MRKLILSKKLLIPIVLVIVIGTFFGGYSYGLNIYQKTLDAIGFVSLTDEATISEIEIDDSTTLKVQAEPNVNTLADVVYTVHVYLDGIDTAQQTVSWTAAEITAITKKTVTFTGLSLAAAAKVKAEITH